MHTQHEETGRQAGSSRERTRGETAYAHEAMGGGVQSVCRGYCRGARDGSALVKDQRDANKKTRTPAGMWSPLELASQARQGSSPSAAEWLGRLQTARRDDWGWENLSMERRELWAMAARNLAMSLLHDITPAGREQTAPSTGRAVQEGRELVQAAGSASSPAEPLSPRCPKQGEASSRKTHPFTQEALWVPSIPSATVPLPKTLGTSLILTPRGTGHALSPSWRSPCSPAAVAALSPRQSWEPEGV